MDTLKNYFKRIVRLFKEEKKIPIPVQTNTTELLKGKVALITGGSGGIGMAIAESFLKNGGKVILGGTNADKLQNCCDDLGGVLDL